MTTKSHITDEQRELLERLRSVRGLANESQWTEFENTLEQLRGTDSPEVVAALFQLFREDDPHDAMERLLHVVEASTLDLYVPALVTATPRLMREARFWAGVLHMRVLQSPDDLHAYAAELVRLRQVHRAACEAAFTDAVKSGRICVPRPTRFARWSKPPNVPRPDDYIASYPRDHRAACEAAVSDAVKRRPDLRPQADAFQAMVAAAERR